MTKYYLVAKANYNHSMSATLSGELKFKGQITSSDLVEARAYFKTNNRYVLSGEHPDEVIITFFHALAEDTQ